MTFADGGEETAVAGTAASRPRSSTWPGRRVAARSSIRDDHLLLEWRRHDNAAFARELDEPDGVSGPAGDLAEALSLAVSGGLGP